MKKTITLLFAVMVAMAAFAQKGAPQRQVTTHSLPVSYQKGAAVKAQGLERTAVAMSNKAIRKASADDELVTPPEGATGEQWYIADGSLNVYGNNGWTDYTDNARTITVIFADNKVYIQGLAYWFESAWIVGDLDGTTVTFPYSTFVGEDDYGAEFFVGTNDIQTACPIVFTYDEEAGTLTSQTTYMAEATEDGGMSWYTYYDNLVLSKTAPEPDVVVEAPADLVTEEWIFTAKDLSFDDDNNPVYEDVSMPGIKVGFDGDDVYVQGLCQYLPEAWVKGVRNGNEVTFTTGQFFGEYSSFYGSYKMYFVGYGADGISDITFTMNADENELSSSDWWILNGKKSAINYFNIFTEPVLTKVKEMAAMPALPEVTAVNLTGSYPSITLNVPTVDENDNPMLTGKLYYKVYTDVDGVISEYECTTADYSEIQENMIEIPYSFSDDWDIYPGGSPLYVYGDVQNWDRVGVQSIYYGADERNATEINWYKINVDLFIAGSFTEPAWQEGKQQLVKGEDGLYTIDVELPENAEFKLIDNYDDWYGGVTDGNNFVITEEQIAQGTALTLSNPGMNFVMPVAGKYTITVDVANMSMVVTKTPAKLYVLGDFQGWKPNEGLQMTYDAATKTYTATITPEAKGCIKFTTQLSETEEWTIDEYLWGAESEGDFIVVKEQLGADLTLKAQGEAFFLPAGEWKLTANLEEGTLVIEGEWPAEAMYVAGSFTDWANEKVAMTKGEDGLYTLDVEMEENAEFKLIDELDHWYGGATDGNNFVITEEQIAEGTALTLVEPGMNFVMPFAGKYTLVVDRANMTLVIKANNAVKGDVNGDGVVSGADVTALYGVLLDNAEVAGEPDVNGDGTVSGTDVTALYNLLLENE